MGQNGLSEEPIPEGWYCYERLGPMDENGRMPIRKCPYWDSTQNGESAYCSFIDVDDDILLWDQVKICNVKKEWPDDEC